MCVKAITASTFSTSLKCLTHFSASVLGSLNSKSFTLSGFVLYAVSGVARPINPIFLPPFSTTP